MNTFFVYAFWTLIFVIGVESAVALLVWWVVSRRWRAGKAKQSTEALRRQSRLDRQQRSL